MSVYFSNKQEILFEHLKRNLFSPSSTPFEKRYLIVPHQAVDTWIRKRVAKEMGICSGIETLFLDQALFKFFGKSVNDHELIFKIEAAISEEEELKSYLEGKEKRLFPLCAHLATLFQRYLLYGFDVEKASIWQERVWQKIFPEGNPYISLLKEEFGLEESASFHLFSFSHLSPVHFELFSKIGMHAPVFFYHISPCQEFWSDMENDFEIGKKNLEAAEPFLEDRHSLLASLGKVGRKFASQVESSLLQTVEEYQIPENESSLGELQRSMLLLQKQAAVDDDSIQLHLFSTPYREIEGLYHALSSLMAEKKIRPSEITVMAPDIALYEPYIRALFSGKIDFQIDDLSADQSNLIVTGFLLLLGLEKNRWSSSALLELFNHPLFAQKMGWSEDDLGQIREWLYKGNIRWGYDRFHVEQLLAASLEFEGKATWKEGLHRLFLSIAEGDIPLTKTQLLGEWAAVVHGLYHDLRAFYDGKKRTCGEWKKILQMHLEKYFAETEELFSVLDCALPEREVPFSFVFSLLTEKWRREPATFQGNHLEAIRFCSAHPMRSAPARVICFIGLNLNDFPRREKLESFDLLKRKGAILTRLDFDRYVLIEAILSARETLILSYVGRSAVDGTEMAPSSLISHLEPYISKDSRVIHGDFAFDRRYFQGKSSLLKNTSSADFEKASLLSQEKKSAPLILTFEKPKELLLPKGEFTLDLRELCLLLKRPLKSYFEKSLKLFFPAEEEVKVEEDFLPSPLEMSKYRREFSRKGKERAREKLQKEGVFTSHSFQSLAALRLESEIETLERTLGLHGIDELMTLHFSPLVKSMREEERNEWQIPSLKLKHAGGVIEIVGKIENVSPQGLVVQDKCLLERCVSYIPLFLALNAAEELPHTIDPTKMIFSKSEVEKRRFFETAEEMLEMIVSYYFVYEKSPSLLFPDWIAPLLEKNSEKLQKKMPQVEFDSSFNLAFAVEIFPDPDKVIEEWHGTADLLYGRWKDAWF